MRPSSGLPRPPAFQEGGPRTPEQPGVARSFLSEPLTEEIASRSGDVFRSLGSPRNRAGDIVIGVTALLAGATLLTRDRRDFEGIPGLRVE
ncbi:MAG: type II toxin-antitoxin system VapC family toxin [Candidatus Eremiobacterota bacterium]